MSAHKTVAHAHAPDLFSHARAEWTQAIPHILSMIHNGSWDAAERALTQFTEGGRHDPQWFVLSGVCHHQARRFTDAAECFVRVLELDPDNIDGLNNLGSSLFQLGKVREAIPCLERAYKKQPNYSCISNLALCYTALNQHAKAIPLWIETLTYDPTNIENHFALAQAYRHSGRLNDFIKTFHDILFHRTNQNDAVAGFIAQIGSFQYYTPHPDARKALLLCLQTDGVNHQLMMPLWWSYVRLDPVFAPLWALADKPLENVSLEKLTALIPALNDPLINLGLKRFFVANTIAELSLCAVRRSLMAEQHQAPEWPAALNPFLGALAIQAWQNEYVYSENAAETAHVTALSETVQQLIANRKIKLRERMLILLYLCYRPLSSLTLNRDDLAYLARQDDDLARCVREQIDEVRIELDLKNTIPSFVPIDDDVSIKVRAQYESKPYPRWKTMSPRQLPQALTDHSRGLKVLNAGCGTGQEAIAFALALPYSEIVAVDLSFSSLAYAKRKAIELGVEDRIRFLQGDLMKLDLLGETFDVIASSGVLHHMKDPERGLQSLIRVLKPTGRLFLCLYSKITRDHCLGPAWNRIQNKGYRAVDSDIRALRSDVMLSAPDDLARRCLDFRDFFSLSECCDLLFHVQEQRYTVLELGAMFERNALAIHSVPQYQNLIDQFRAEFGAEGDLNDLALWNAFEEKNPTSIQAMHRFWLKPQSSADAPNPVDALISAGCL